MAELLTAAEMRAIEAAAIASGAVTGLELMERAGRGVVEAILAEWPELEGAGGGAAPTPPGYFGQNEAGRAAGGLAAGGLAAGGLAAGGLAAGGLAAGDAARGRRAVVLCGPGNNGGDGFVVARLLRERGWEVEVFLYGDPAKLPPDARVNYERWRGMGEVGATQDLEPEDFLGASVVVDAIFGIGLARGLDSNSIGVLLALNDCFPSGETRPLVIAIDLPSGFDADSGKCLTVPETIYPNHFPDLTVTFECAKIGHFLLPLAERCTSDVGTKKGLSVVPLGLADFVEGRPFTQGGCELLDRPGGMERLSLQKSLGEHKFTHGHALILSGPVTRTGAARLAARGALRIGAGLVTIGAPADALAEHAAQVTAVMLREVGTVEGLRVVLEDARINAVCVGPGLGLDARGREIVAGVIAAACEGERRAVLDADALTHLAREPALFAALHDRCVLTPHAGEFARLFPDIAERLAAPATKGPAYSKVDATRDAAAQAGCVVLFKGADTVIADPAGRCSVNAAVYDRAAPWLATAGSGDVLAGFIAGLMARGFGPMQAAETAAWLHVECARSFGPGLIAEDLAEALPKVFRALGL